MSAPKTADTTTQLEIARHGAKNKPPSGQERKGGNKREKEIRQGTWSHISLKEIVPPVKNVVMMTMPKRHVFSVVTKRRILKKNANISEQQEWAKCDNDIWQDSSYF